jgi:uncharacterized protein YpmS
MNTHTIFAAPVISNISSQATANSEIPFTITNAESGDITLTVISLNTGLISNANINVAGSGSNSSVQSVTAGNPVPLTLSLSPTANEHGLVTLTVTAIDSDGYTNSKYFTVIVSPPGAGNALVFDGGDDFVSFGSIPESHPLALSGSNFSLSFWIKPVCGGDEFQRIIDKSSGSRGSNGYSVLLMLDKSMQFAISGTYRFITDPNIIKADQWTHVAFTAGNSEYKCYINGVSVNNTTSTSFALPPNAETNLNFGSYYDGNSRLYNGELDEVSIWNRALSESDVRENMCTKLNGDETGLLAYYRFDHNSGTILTDLSGNNYDATLTNMDNSSWVTSGAAIGDVSVYGYTGSVASDFIVNLASSEGDHFTATGDGGSYLGIQLYLINESSNVTVPPNGWNGIDSNHYWGVFPVGTSPTYGVIYNYNGNTFVDNENVLNFAYRKDNSINSWSDASTTLNTSLNTLSQSSYARAEFVLGDSFVSNILEVPDQTTAVSDITFTITCAQSGNMNITVTSSNNTLISNANINVAGSGSNIYVESVTADNPVPLTLSLSSTANEYGCVTLTVTVKGPNGMISSKNFTVIVFPPGAGNALVFDGDDDFVSFGSIPGTHPLALSGSNFSLSFWIKPVCSGDEFQRIIDKSTGSDGSNGYVIYIELDKEINFCINGTCNFVTEKNILKSNVWSHVALTAGNSEYKCYINGVSVNNTRSTAFVLPPNAQAPLHFGTWDNESGREFNGQLDEVSIWNRVLSESDVRNNMCKKLSGNETGLLAYYRFDHNSGTILTDLSGNSYDGTLTNMDNSSWVTSGAAIGDESVYDYTGSVASDFIVNLTSSEGDQFTATGDGGTYTGIHLYLINESSNITVPPNGWNSIDSSHYWGIFPVGTTPTYEIRYNYNGNPFVTNKSDISLAKRDNNSITTWSQSNASLNTISNTFSQSEYPRAEFILGDVSSVLISEIPEQIAATQEIPFTITATVSGDITITVTSSNDTLLTNSNINIRGSGSNVYVQSVIASTPVPLSITLSPTANEYGIVILTVTAIDSAGYTCSTMFSVIVSPLLTGAGNALVFDGDDDYVTLGSISGSHPLALAGSNFSMCFWIKPSFTGYCERIIDKSTGTYGANGFSLYLYSTHRLKFTIGGSTIFTTSNNSLTPNIWQHFVITANNSEYKCYVNGSSVEINMGSFALPPNATADLYLGKMNNSLTRMYNGQMDEVSIWNRALSETEIRDCMCKRLTGNENGLLVYFRFDSFTGTTLTDLSGNNYHGTLTDMDNSNWVTSGAAIGDVSVYDYTGSVASDFIVNLVSSEGDQFTATGDGGSYSGIHLYLINEAPNVTTPPTGCNAIDTDHYWGIFPVGTNPTYEITYNYTGNSFVDNENALKLAYREYNSITNWSDANTTLNTSLNTLSESSYTRAEFVLGEISLSITEIPAQATAASDIPFSVTYAQSGDITITVTSSNNTLINNANINVAGSGSYTYVENVTGGNPVPLTLSLSPTANEHGLVTLTVTAIDSDGYTNSKYFTVIVSPPGAGNALDFDGTDDYVSANVLSTGTNNFSMEAWVKWDGTGSSSNIYIVYNGNASSSGFGLILKANDQYLGYICGGVTTTFTGRKLIPDKWEHIAVVNSSGTWSFYLNGESLSIGNVNPNLPVGILSIGSTNTGDNNFGGEIDEVRIWNTPRTQTDIRNNMCKRLTGNETDLLTYYRFDHFSGTTLNDLTGNNNHGTLNNMDDSDWVVSAAALGDISIVDYTGSIASDFVVNLASSNGDQFTATGDGGSYSGIHLYLINEPPNITSPPTSWNAIDTDHYWGIFPVGTFPTYNITYNYNGNAFVTEEDALKLAYREDNSVSSWSRSTATTDTGLNTISKSNETRAEYILAENMIEISDIPTQQITDSPITITITDKTGGESNIIVTSSNNTIISNANINIAGSGSNSYTHTTTANVPVPLTIAILNTADQYGFVTLTVIAQNSNGVTCTNYFYVIVSPPGPGYALNFNGEGKGVSADIATRNTNFCMELWIKWSGSYGNYSYFHSFIACNGGTGSNGYAILLTPDYRYLGYYCSSGFGTENIGRTPLVNKWEHVALVVNGGNLYFYVNGILELTKTGTPSELNGGLRLGNSGNSQEYWPN